MKKIVTQPILKLWVSSEAQWELLSINSENMEQWGTFSGATSQPKLLQELNDDSPKRKQKNPQKHLKNMKTRLDVSEKYKQTSCQRQNTVEVV